MLQYAAASCRILQCVALYHSVLIPYLAQTSSHFTFHQLSTNHRALMQKLSGNLRHPIGLYHPVFDLLSLPDDYDGCVGCERTHDTML